MRLSDLWILSALALIEVPSNDARSLLNTTGIAWHNDYYEPLLVECSEGYGLVHILSIHENEHEDRRWRFECRKFPHSRQFADCSWTENEQSELNHALFHQCPENQVMTGVQSEADFMKKDRLWRYKCCGSEGFVTRSCSTTTYINHFDHPFIFSAPQQHFLIGIFSFYKEYYHDRRWRVSQCVFGQDQPDPNCSKSQLDSDMDLLSAIDSHEAESK